jgi:hypothetical protein
MGFHVRDGGEGLADDVWKNYELAMIMPMKLERERCVGDNKEGLIIGGKED